MLAVAHHPLFVAVFAVLVLVALFLIAARLRKINKTLQDVNNKLGQGRP
jgi:hypothetical protein